jgi:hydroxyacid-oxoacid transhydrogenase
MQRGARRAVLQSTDSPPPTGRDNDDIEGVPVTIDTQESVFTYQAPPFKFGAGALDEIGHDLRQLGVGRVLVLTDAGVAGTGLAERVKESAVAAGVEVVIFDDVHVEPTNESFKSAIAFAKSGEWDGFVAVGGGSVIDTAKAVNLYTTYPAELLHYVNAPFGEGAAPPGPLKPLIAVPTTAGTGAESTAVCVLDLLDLKVKTGISHSRLRPTMAIIDPLTSLTLPAAVTAACGMDILGHAIESYTARPYTEFAKKEAAKRVAYCGSNPVSDLWCQHAIKLVGTAFRKAVSHGDDEGARTDMMLAATFAGMGFGNAGVHIPHACAYPIAGNVRDYRPDGYDVQEPMVPHGQAVAVTTPAAFRLTFDQSPQRHVDVAAWLDPQGAADQENPREKLPSVLSTLMRDIGIPNGIGALGYEKQDIPTLVAGAVKQHRLLGITPFDVTEDHLEQVFADSLSNW